jgi:hypothetical protein
MTPENRSEILYLKKLQNLIPNQLNVEGLTWKKTINYTKGSKIKMTFKKIGIKIQIQNKLYFLLNGEIEKKN